MKPVVVVGAGPVGITAATLLAQRGIDVIVRKRHRAPYPLPRAVHLDDEIYRILEIHISCGRRRSLARGKRLYPRRCRAPDPAIHRSGYGDRPPRCIEPRVEARGRPSRFAARVGPRDLRARTEVEWQPAREEGDRRRLGSDGRAAQRNVTIAEVADEPVLRTWFPKHGARAVLVRPDRIVAATARRDKGVSSLLDHVPTREEDFR